MQNKVKPHSFFSDFDISLFKSGKHFKLYEKFGAHIAEVDGESGCYFSVFAPSAYKVEIVGSFNFWNGEEHALYVRWDSSGIWEGFIPGIGENELYKFRIYSNHDDKVRDKADPYAFKTEMMPKTASVIHQDNYKWKDKKWIEKERVKKNSLDAPFSIYEVHLGSWKKQGAHSLSYREMATELVNYVKDMGFTHVEFMPVTEHPFYPSWGYLSTSYFAPTSRFGDPEELKLLIDEFHKVGVGVIIDWVPAHFPNDDFALADFDGSCVYEHFDIQKGFHPDWNSLIFNFERNEVCSFLISSAFFWIEKYHVDGLRVDAVSSMIYLDYSREDGQWSPNIFGGNEYLAAIDFLKELNSSVYGAFPGIQVIAEESTAYPGITAPVHMGGLGFGMKWMMGWMNDTLDYFSRDPIYRSYHHNEISFSMAYAYSENYVLPLSHDEVVYGKQSIAYKMPGDDWQRFANVRLLYGYMFTHPGNKLLFMGDEIGQTSEWNVNGSIDWDLLEHLPHRGIQQLVKDLNKLFKQEKALYADNFVQDGFQWISFDDHSNCILAYIRKAGKEELIVVCNFTPQFMDHYKIGVPMKGAYELILNTDDIKYGGSGVISYTEYETEEYNIHGMENAIGLQLAPLGVMVLKRKK